MDYLIGISDNIEKIQIVVLRNITREGGNFRWRNSDFGKAKASSHTLSLLLLETPRDGFKGK